MKPVGGDIVERLFNHQHSVYCPPLTAMWTPTDPKGRIEKFDFRVLHFEFIGDSGKCDHLKLKESAHYDPKAALIPNYRFIKLGEKSLYLVKIESLYSLI